MSSNMLHNVLKYLTTCCPEKLGEHSHRYIDTGRVQGQDDEASVCESREGPHASD